MNPVSHELPVRPRFGLGRQAALAATLLVAGLGASAGVAYFHQWQLSHAIRNILEGEFARTTAAYKTACQAARCRQSQLAAENALDSQSQQQKAAKAWNECVDELQRELDSLALLVTDDADRAMVAQWQAALREYRAAFSRALRQLETRSPATRSATHDLAKSPEAILEQVLDGTQQFARRHETQAKAAWAEMSRLAERRIRFINVRAVLGLLAVGALALWFHRYVLAPIQGLLETARQFIAGNSNARAPYAANDELGCLAYYFNHMASAIGTGLSQGQTLGASDTRGAATALAVTAGIGHQGHSSAGSVGAGAPQAFCRGPEQALGTLAYAPYSAVRHQAAQPPLQEPPLSRFRILVAEDGPENRRLMIFVLTKAGAEVIAVNNGQEAIDKALAGLSGSGGQADSPNKPFDLILMDMEMPFIDGYEATRRLREAGYTGPILAVTAHTLDYDRQQCLEAGCNDYLAKPLDRETLLATVFKHLLPQRTAPGECPAAQR